MSGAKLKHEKFRGYVNQDLENFRGVAVVAGPGSGGAAIKVKTQ